MAYIYYKKWEPSDEEPYVELSNTQKDSDWTQWTSGTVSFSGEDIFVKDDKLELPSNCKSLFESCNLFGIPGFKLDTSNVASMERMFYNATKGVNKTLDMTSWDLSKVVTMSEMFAGNARFTSITFGSHPESTLLGNLSSMFAGYTSGTSIDMSGVNTEKVNTMASMFASCSNLTSISMGSTARVNTMSNMFFNCSKLTSLTFTDLDTENLTNTSTMFRNCSLQSFDFSSFNTHNVTDMSYMFNGAGFTSLDLSNFDTSNVTSITNMFNGASALTSLNLTSFDTTKLNNLNSLFRGCASLTELDLSSFDTSGITSTQNTFYACINLITIKVSPKWTMANVTSSGNMFTNCMSLTGGAGTTYADDNPRDKTYAHDDGGIGNPGYLTLVGWVEHELWIKEDGAWKQVEVYA